MKTETLELKHLAPYLPYNLKFQIFITGESPKNDELEVLSYIENCITFSKSPDYYLEDPEDNETEIKPILRPLSDITKEIEVNGEKFFPIKLLTERCELQNKLFGLQNYLDLKVIDYFKLPEWHFDVFGLIEKGLAIDINTL